ncbi:unnamed protein product [Didymodactylos carnosus]|uniref:ABC transporter domain-containing protein n=1 Tax=Didymodactylos carnosus TaxID=1234261 RepID=A0A8S2HYN9_9BILA|nr:unnamed protein product [Didymodactylos carnosus]CAF3693728.1 unnamed protein product [Didymodactylos carnosus]
MSGVLGNVEGKHCILIDDIVDSGQTICKGAKLLMECGASGERADCVFLGEEYHFDLIRIGAALYGINPSGALLNNPLHNPVRLTAPIIQLQELSAEDYIGYNMTFKTDRNSIIATLPLGYADGYSRALSNYGEVFIDSYRAPVVGRISMDLITIDVTDLPPEKFFLGQQVEIIGNNCTPDQIANIINTIGYEVLTMMELIMRDEKPKIKIRSLYKAFGNHQVLAGVDLDIKENSSTVILGGSGSGKSVLIKTIVGLIRPDNDEPTTGLDPIMANVINELIIKIQEELNVTTITITHDMNSAYMIAKEVTMLYQGKILWFGTKDEIKNSDNPYLQQFVNGLTSGPIEV